MTAFSADELYLSWFSPWTLTIQYVPDCKNHFLISHTTIAPSMVSGMETLYSRSCGVDRATEMLCIPAVPQHIQTRFSGWNSRAAYITAVVCSAKSRKKTGRTVHSIPYDRITSVSIYWSLSFADSSDLSLCDFCSALRFRLSLRSDDVMDGHLTMEDMSNEFRSHCEDPASIKTITQVCWERILFLSGSRWWIQYIYIYVFKERCT